MEEKEENDRDETEKMCKYCLDGKDSVDLILSPCDCQGTSKHVHQECLAQWIKTKYASTLRINVLQQSSMTYTLQCTECRGDYTVKISPAGWNAFLYRLLFDRSNQKILQKIFLQMAWILFQSTTLGLVSKSFIKSVSEFGNNHSNVKVTSDWKRFFQQLINHQYQSMAHKLTALCFCLLHPFSFIQQMTGALMDAVKRNVRNGINYILNPFRILQCMLHYLKRILLFTRSLFLFVLIVQHTASITFNINKLYQAFNQHKLNLVKLQILPKAEASSHA